MQLRRLVALVATVVIVPLTAWSAPGPAAAACPIEGCGGGDPEHTYTSQLTVSRSAGTVTSNTVGGHAISCGITCTVTDSQTTSDAERPTDGWPTYTLTASGGPTGYSPSWSPSGLGCGRASTCQVTNDQQSRTVTLGWVDTTAPGVTFNPPARVGPAGYSVGASGSDNSGSVASYRWTVDGVLAGSTGATLSMSAWSHGDHTVAVQAMDASGNLSAAVTRVVTVDKAVAVVISPVAPFVAVAPVLHLAADADVVSLACRVDGGAFAPCTSPWAPALADGARTVEVRATDDMGNVATAARSFVMDSTAPALAFTDAPAEGALIAGGATSITVQQVETNPGALVCSVDGAPVGCAPGGAVALTGLAAGGHTFAVTATDKAGNTATLARHFAVQAPSAPAPAPAPATPGTGGGHAATATQAGLRGPARVAPGARVRFQVAVSAPSGSSLVPTGLVTWTVDGKRVCRTPLHDGRATCRTARLARGRHVVVASYAGSGDFAAATVRKVVVARR